MGIYDSKLYRGMEYFTNFFLLNFLWILMCIPAITIFPATAAMFGVVREWKRKGDIKLFSSFFRYFKENVKLGVKLEIVWGIIAYLLFINFHFTNQISSNFKGVLLTIYFLVLILFLFTTIYIFPVMVQFKVTWIQAIRNAIVLSLIKLPFTIVNMLILVACGYLVYHFPIFILIVFSVASYFIYAVTDWIFMKLQKEKI